MNITSYSAESFWTNSTNYSDPTVTTATTIHTFFDPYDSYQTIPQTQTITEYPSVYISTKTDATRAQSWDLETFFTTAASLAFGSIIIPIISGTCIRWTTRCYYRNKGWIIPLVYLLWYL